ncbi:hypothetical protein SEA_BUBBABEAR_10 [Microbacterium phage BubbaBear]|uniref:hypothetical protein n=1 Tax=Microbacterium phage BubbaBear TaxID=2572529 RepID=UPI0010C47F76|nr:hypothetical protein QDW44_gp10 [Microbacterium phage BubbaBear]QCG77271.1 hypothetical protein SEA_BUBBABEAR_10 [Microbacterium phage BubbaBear]
MALSSRIKMNTKGIVALLKSQEVQDDLAARGERIAASLPTDDKEEWKVNNFLGYDRANTVVRTANVAAQRTQAETNALLRALDRGR